MSSAKRREIFRFCFCHQWVVGYLKVTCLLEQQFSVQRCTLKPTPMLHLLLKLSSPIVLASSERWRFTAGGWGFLYFYGCWQSTGTATQIIVCPAGRGLRCTPMTLGFLSSCVSYRKDAERKTGLVLLAHYTLSNLKIVYLLGTCRYFLDFYSPA